MASCGTHSSDGPTEHARFRSGKVAPRLRLSRRLALSVAEFLHPSTTRRLVNGPSARPSAGCTLVRALSRSRLPFYPREQMALESGSGRAHRGVKVSLCTFVGRRPLVLYVSIYGLSFDTACQYVLGNVFVSRVISRSASCMRCASERIFLDALPVVCSSMAKHFHLRSRPQRTRTRTRDETEPPRRSASLTSMGANSLSFLKLAALCALLASCAGLSAPLGEHENKVNTTYVLTAVENRSKR